MLTSDSRQPPVAIFFFCHQDDEFGVYQQILVERHRGRRVVCAYLTSGVPSGGDPARRNHESLAVLRKLGVAGNDVIFAGAHHGIADGCLGEKMQLASDWMTLWLVSFFAIEAIYVPAWEGGHPDHDALHAVVVQLCSEMGMDERVRQFSLYNAFRCPGQLFRVLHPLQNNGSIERTRIPWGRRIVFLRYTLSYQSQLASWIGLFPFILLHHLFFGWQDIQPVSKSRICERPHNGPLYYEKRRFSSWPQMHLRVTNWLSDRQHTPR